MHRGGAAIGAAAASFKTGRYSKAFGGIAGRVQQALDDPERLAMSHEIALLDARLGEIVEQPMNPLAWGEVVDLVEQRRKLVESERKRMLDIQQMMSATEAVTFVMTVLSVVKRHVDDRATLADLSNELERLIRRPDPARVGRAD